VESRNEVFRLRAELSKAEEHLKTVEARGTFLDQFANAVTRAENTALGLVNSFTRLVTNQLLENRFGQVVHVGSVSKETRREMLLHVRLSALKKFHISRDERNDQENLYRRAEAVFGKLTDLKEHIARDQKENAKS
jgi:hypothetical protein